MVFLQVVCLKWVSQAYNYQAQVSYARDLLCSMSICVSRSAVSDSHDPMDCSPPGSSVHGNSPGKNTGMGCHALLQGIFPTQGLNSGLPHCRWIFYHLSHQGSPKEATRRAYLRLLIFLLEILIPACESSSLTFPMMYSAYKLNKQGDNIQPWCTHFPILN